MASVQFQVTVDVPPQAGGGPNDALHEGSGVHDVEAVAVAVAPPAPVVPAEPTGYGIEPEHGTAPLDGVVPGQT